MFDCGQYTYAVSELQHMAVRRFKIVRIDKDLEVYFGHNKMVTRLDINTGEFAYFTNKSDEELAALNNIRKL